MDLELKTIAANLQQDIDVVCCAYDAFVEALERIQKLVREQYPDVGLHVDDSIEFAMWAHYEFDGNWDALVEFTRRSVEAYSGRKGNMWLLDGPHKQKPRPEAHRHLDRIDVALRVLAQELQLELPFKPVRDHQVRWGEPPGKHFQRIQAFARSVNDVLNPQNT